MLDQPVVRWEDISREAKSLFKVWTDGRGLDWAKKSWEALCKHRLTSYANEIERTRVLVRLLALAAIYRDFCELAFEEVHYPEHIEWASELCVSTFRLAQCVGLEFHRDENEEDEALVESALVSLMEEARANIHEALQKDFGGDGMVFVSLWNSVNFSRNEEDSDSVEDEDPDLNDDNIETSPVGEERDTDQSAKEFDWFADADLILNTDLTWQKQAAYAWIDQGMQSVH